MLSRFAPPLAARLAARLFGTPRRHRTPPRERRWIEGAEPLRFAADGIELQGWALGEGPTVLLVHGWEGRGSQLGAFAAPMVEAGYRVVAFDAKAHGASPGKRFSLPEFARSVRQVADEIGPVHAIVAHSFGTAAATVAIGNGLAAERVVYLAPPAQMNVYIDGFLRLVGFSADVGRRMIALYERRLGFDWDALQPADVAARTAALPELLVVWDRDDEDVAEHHAPELVEAWGEGAELFVTEGLGHRGILRDPTVIDRAVAFVAR